MSSRYVRNLVRQWATDATVQVPFYDTVNLEQDPNDPVWFTVEFVSFGHVVESYCGKKLEEGELRFVFFGQPGIGDDALLQAAEGAAKAVAVKTDPAGALVLNEPSPPVDYLVLPFTVEIPVLYEYFT